MTSISTSGGQSLLDLLQGPLLGIANTGSGTVDIILDGGNRIRLTGTGFTFNGPDGKPDAGLITGFEVYDSSNVLSAWSTHDLPNVDLTNFYLTLGGPPAGALEFLLPGIETYTGTSGADSISVHQGGVASGGGGADTIQSFGTAPAAGTTLNGDAGNDTLIGTADDDVLNGGNDDDTLTGNGGSDSFSGGAGNDTINAGLFATAIDGGTGNDKLSFQYLFGDPIVANLLTGRADVNGATPTLLFTGIEFLTNFTTGGGDDQVTFRTSTGLGTQTWNGGGGTDTAILSFAGSATPFTLGVNSGQILVGTTAGNGFVLAQVEHLVLTGTGGNDEIVVGSSSDDDVRGGLGVDTLRGGAGNDIFRYGANEAASGELVDGGANTDSIRVTASNNFSGATISGIESIVFEAAATLIFNASVSATTQAFVGNAAVNKIAILLAAGADVDFFGWSASGWTLGTDTVSLTGSGASDQVRELLIAGATLNGAAGYDRVAFDLSATSVGRTLDLTNVATTQTLTNGRTFVNFEAFNSYFGSGNDVITGGNGAPGAVVWTDPTDDVVLLGGGGDTFFGRGGDDFAEGQAGNDTLTMGAGQDTANGGDDDDILDGGAGNDIMIGGNGNDQLFSRLNEGPDQLTGGAGTDFAFIDRSNLSVSLTLDLADTTQGLGLADGSYIEGIERFEFRAGLGNDTITGGALGDIIVGNAGRDLISGGAGDDVLDGGDGVDIINGDAGNDTIMGRAGVDILSGDAGNDALRGGDSADTLDGDLGDDQLAGEAGSDNLDGGAGNDSLDGGTGIDVMAGGGGDDSYVVDNVSDLIFEEVSQGTDTVMSFVDITLADNVERVTLAGGPATHASGNALANTITGNAFANVIDGKGGADTMAGGNGNDAYFADVATDIVVETNGVLATGGNDVVHYLGAAGTTYALSDFVERLALANGLATNGTGNELANQIYGNAAANVLNGGLGSDTISSGAGNDIIVFDTALSAANVDTLDFNVAADTMRLKTTIFAAIGPTLTANELTINTTGGATAADQRLIYESDTGRLIYDSNGNLDGGDTQFAATGLNLVLTVADFQLF